MKRSVLLDCLLLSILTGALIQPLFRLRYLDNWASIESTFISDARFLDQHWPHPRWQPLWYCGTRFDYVYPPALRYGTAAMVRVFALEPVRAYHVYCALFYCLGIAGIYFLARVGGGSRGAAWLAACGGALLAPSLPLLPAAAWAEGWWRVPQRLGVLLRWGEGPHISALAVIPTALGLAWIALRRGRRLAVAAAAAACALVVSTNFYGAASLAMFFPLLVGSLWITYQDPRIWRRAAAVAALGYGLTAFWLTPSYLRVTLDNMKWVARPGNAWSVVILAAALAAWAGLSYKLARGRPERAWTVFLAGSLVVFSLVVMGFFHFGLRIMGEASRQIPELDLVLILASAEVVRRVWQLPQRAARTACWILVALAFFTGARYVRHAWSIFPPDPHYQQRVEYQLSGWVARNLPDARVYTSGSVRFWYDAWHDLAEVGGGSDQGLLNGILMAAQWHIMQDRDPALATLWLQALGADAVIVHGKASREIYHDFADPGKFAGLLRVLYENGVGDVIYEVPRRAPGLARVVDAQALRALPPVAPEGGETLRAYVAAVEHGPDAPASITWQGTDTLVVHARTSVGEAVVVQVTYDPSWRAYVGAREAPIRKDPLGFMLIEAPPGDQPIRMVFELPFENAAGRVLSLLALAVFCGAALRPRRA